MSVAGARPGVAYQLMPITNGGRGGATGAPVALSASGSPGGRPRTGPSGMPSGAAGGGRGLTGGRGGGRGGAPPPTTTTVPTGTPGIRYNENVRNPAVRPTAAAPPTEPPEPAVGPTPAGSALTLKALAAAPEKQKKQLIGEQLFPLIKQREPVLAGKITGMLLEMDNHELIHLLESSGALFEKITEALAVLHAHETAQANAVASSDGGEEEETE
jgi:polyadenylate-binding protein